MQHLVLKNFQKIFYFLPDMLLLGLRKVGNIVFLDDLRFARNAEKVFWFMQDLVTLVYRYVNY